MQRPLMQAPEFEVVSLPVSEVTQLAHSLHPRTPLPCSDLALFIGGPGFILKKFGAKWDALEIDTAFEGPLIEGKG